MVEFRNIPKFPPKISELPLSERETTQDSQTSLRFQIEGQNLDFKNGKILLNNQSLADHLKENINHLGAQYWTTVASRLGKYRDWVALNAQDPETIAQVFALITDFLTKIYGRINKKFDETQDGMGFLLDEDGQFLLNGVNVNACIRVVKRFPQKKRARVFLKGIRQRLAIIQANRGGKPSYEKVRDTVNRLASEIDVLLAQEVVSDSPVIELPAGSPELLS